MENSTILGTHNNGSKFLTTRFPLDSERSTLLLGIHNNGSKFISTASPFDWEMTTVHNITNMTNATKAPAIISDAEARFNLSTDINLYVLIVVIALGLVCNPISIFVFMKTKMRQTNTGIYLTTLAIADIIGLLAELAIWVSSPQWKLEFVLLNSHLAVCMLTFYLRYAARLWSSLLTCIITIERFLLVMYPLKVSSILTRKVAKINVLWTTLVSFALSIYAFFTLELSMSVTPPFVYRCSLVEHLQKTYNTLLLVITIGISDLLSSTVIFVFTFLIIIKLTSLAKDRQSKLNTNQNDKGKGQKERQITVILLAVAISFLLLRVPYVVAWCYRQFVYFMLEKVTDLDSFFDMTTAINYTYIFNTMNMTINFFLYSLCGSSFRQSLQLLCCPYCQKKKKMPASTNMTNMSHSTSTQSKLAPSTVGSTLSVNKNSNGATTGKKETVEKKGGVIPSPPDSNHTGNDKTNGVVDNTQL